MSRPGVKLTLGDENEEGICNLQLGVQDAGCGGDWARQNLEVQHLYPLPPWRAGKRADLLYVLYTPEGPVCISSKSRVLHKKGSKKAFFLVFSLSVNQGATVYESAALCFL